MTAQLDPTTAGQISLDKRLSLLEQSVTNGFSQLRIDLHRVFEELTRRDNEQQKQIDAIQADFDALNTEHIGRCAETRLAIERVSKLQEENAQLRETLSGVKERLNHSEHTLGLISKIGAAGGLTILGLIIERIAAVL